MAFVHARVQAGSVLMHTPCIGELVTSITPRLDDALAPFPPTMHTT
jgi:hypothetical protein